MIEEPLLLTPPCKSKPLSDSSAEHIATTGSIVKTKD